MRWTMIALLLCAGCVPDLDNCEETADCSSQRVCSAGYCLPVDAATPDAQPIDQRVVDAADAVVDAAPVDAAVDAAPVDAAPVDAAPDAAPDGARPLCEAGEARACPEEVGVCDPGQQICRAGAWSACEGRVVRVEACDGADTDCDGQVDEGFQVGADCAVGEGECAVSGAIACTDAGTAECDAEPLMPEGPEVCTRLPDPFLDEDCDGRVDESIGEGVVSIGDELIVAVDAAAPGQIAGDSHLDIAVTSTHTALLLRALDAPPELRVYAHRADGSLGPGAPVPLPAAATQLQVATRGGDFVVAGLLPSINNAQPVHVQVVRPNGGAGEAQVTNFPGRADGLKLVDSPPDRSIFFVHIAGATEVRMRAIVDGENDDNRTLSAPSFIGPWAAAADGPAAYLVWVTANALEYRQYSGSAVMHLVADLAIGRGPPALALSDAPVVFTVNEARNLVGAVIRGDEASAGPNLVNVDPVAPIAVLGLDGHFVVSARSNESGVLALFGPTLRRGFGSRVSLTVRDGPPVIATAGPRGSAAWISADGNVMLRPIWTGCASIRPRFED